MNLKSIIIVAMLAISIVACGKSEVPHVKTSDELRQEALANSEKNRKLQDLLEQQRSTAMDNALRNAANYFAANPRFDSSWKTVGHTDDQISPACPQGSGWAWVSIMKVEGKEVDKKRIWCSTASTSLGCYIEDDFLKGPFAKQSKSCDPDLPHPLKPIK